MTFNIPDKQIDVVAISVHPDDVDITVGGTLAKLSSNGITTGIIDLSNGEPTPSNTAYRSPNDFDSDYDIIRKQEAQSSKVELGVNERITLDIPNRTIKDNFENRCKVATVLRAWKPKLVILPMAGKSPNQSPDHYEANLIANASLFYSKLSKWDEYMGNYPVHEIEKFVYYPFMDISRLHFHPSDESGKYTSFLSDFTEVVNKKRNALKSYVSQYGDNPDSRIAGLLQYNSILAMAAGINGYCEHLLSYSIIPINMSNFKEFFL